MKLLQFEHNMLMEHTAQSCHFVKKVFKCHFTQLPHKNSCYFEIALPVLLDCGNESDYSISNIYI